MLKYFVVLALVFVVGEGVQYPGKCPTLTPELDFDEARVKIDICIFIDMNMFKI